jgi:hypothetical protein
MAYGSGFPLPLQGAVTLGPQPRRELVPPVKFCGLHRGPRCRQRFVSDPIALGLRFNPPPASPGHRIAASLLWVSVVVTYPEIPQLLTLGRGADRPAPVQWGSEQVRPGSGP